MEKKKAKRTASRQQLIAINDLLRECIVKSPDSNLVDYKDGFDDHVVAKKLGVKLASVKGARQELYGALRTHRTLRVGQVETQLEELRVKYHRLVTILALQRVADVRHLALVDMDKHPAPSTIPVVKSA